MAVEGKSKDAPCLTGCGFLCQAPDPSEAAQAVNVAVAMEAQSVDKLDGDVRYVAVGSSEASHGMPTSVDTDRKDELGDNAAVLVEEVAAVEQPVAVTQKTEEDGVSSISLTDAKVTAKADAPVVAAQPEALTLPKPEVAARKDVVVHNAHDHHTKPDCGRDLRTGSCTTNFIHYHVSNAFYAYGMWLERRPCTAIGIAMLVICLSCLGFLAVDVRSESAIFVPADSVSQAHRDEVTAAFAGTSTTAALMWSVDDGRNILDFDVLNLVLLAQNSALAVKASTGQALWEVCNSKCKASGLFEQYNIKTTADLKQMYPIISARWTVLAGFFGNITWGDKGDVIAATALRGSVTMDTVGLSLPVAEHETFMEDWALSLADTIAEGTYPLPGSTDQVALAAATKAGGALQVYGYNQYSMDRLTGRMVTAEAPLMGATMGLILAFMSLILGGRCPRDSRVGMAFFSVITCVTSLGTALGLGSAVGVPFTSMSPLLFFALLGIGVDDIVIVVRAVDDARNLRMMHLVRVAKERANDPEAAMSNRDPSEKEAEWDGIFAEALSKAGVAITITSATSALAFGVASTATIPMVKWFCYHGMLGILAVYFIQLTLFSGFFVLDERRKRSGRWDVFCCKQSRSQVAAVDSSVASHSPTSLVEEMEQLEKNRTLSIGGKFMGCCATKLMSRPWFLVLCLASWAGVLGLLCSYLPTLTGDVDLKTYIPDSSPERLYMDMNDLVYTNNTRVISMMMRGNTMPSTATLESLPVVFSDMAKLDFVTMPILPEELWVHAYLAWLNSTSTTPLFQSYTSLQGTELKKVLDPLQADPKAFAKSLKEFFLVQRFTVIALAKGGLVEPVTVRPVSFEKHFAFDSNGEVFFTRMNFEASVPARLSQRISALNTMKKQLATTTWGTDPIHAYMHADFFVSTERDEDMVNMIVSNLIYSSLGVTASVMIIMHPLAGLFVGCVIGMLDASLLGFLAMVDQPLDFVAFILLTMSVGMSVDYIVHTVHAMVDTPPHHTPNQRLDTALRAMGTCILEGGVSTFLGVCMLGFASSHAFRTFFVIMSTCVALGLCYGLVWAPSILWLMFTVKDAIKPRPPPP